MILARGQLYEHSCQEEILQRMGSERPAHRKACPQTLWWLRWTRWRAK